MSEFVHSLPGNVLSYEAREVACHAIEMYTNRLQLGADNLKVMELNLISVPLLISNNNTFDYSVEVLLGYSVNIFSSFYIIQPSSLLHFH